jgi:hypothetical protein
MTLDLHDDRPLPVAQVNRNDTVLRAGVIEGGLHPLEHLREPRRGNGGDRSPQCGNGQRRPGDHRPGLSWVLPHDASASQRIRDLLAVCEDGPLHGVSARLFREGRLQPVICLPGAARGQIQGRPDDPVGGADG